MKPSYVDELERYELKGIPCGRFLQAVLENDLKTAVILGTPQSLSQLRDIVMFIQNNMNPECYGSPEKYRNWLHYHKSIPKFTEAHLTEIGNKIIFSYPIGDIVPSLAGKDIDEIISILKDREILNGEDTSSSTWDNLEVIFTNKEKALFFIEKLNNFLKYEYSFQN
jgi:hypothetical protein